MMVTDHEMRMEALRLFEENERLRSLLSEERARTDRVQSLLDRQQYENDYLSVAQVRRSLVPNPALPRQWEPPRDQNGTEITGPACACCEQMPRPDCLVPGCAFQLHNRAAGVGK